MIKTPISKGYNLKQVLMGLEYQNLKPAHGPVAYEN